MLTARALRQRPGTLRFVAIVGVMLGTMAVSSLIGHVMGTRDRTIVAGYPRVAAPGAATVTLGQPGTYLVYYETVPPDYTEPPPPSPIHVAVVDPNGVEVAVTGLDGARRTEFNGEHAGVAVGRFTAGRAGTYQVTVTGGPRLRGDVAIGQDFASPTIDEIILLRLPGVDQTTLVLPALTAIGAVTLGIGLARRRGLLAGRGRMWRRQLAMWSLGGPDGDEAAAVREIMRCWSRLSGSMAIGSGAGTLLAGAVIAALIPIAGRPVFDPANALLVLPYLGLIAGGALGYAAGVAELRRTSAGGITYADLRPRRAGDYRSVLLAGLPALLIAVFAVIWLAIAVLRGPVPQLWVAGLPLLAMLLTLVASEVLIVHVVGVPRLLAASGTDASRRADDMLRSHVIVSVQGTALLAIAWLGIQATAGLGVAADHVVPDLLLIALLLACLALMPCGALMWATWGRLGGRVTGWPWGRAVGR